MADLLTSPVPHDQAAAFIRGKPILASDVFNRLLPDLQARAFVISGVEDANVVQRVRDLVAQLPEGGDWDNLKDQIAGEISPWLDTGTEEGAASSSGGGSEGERRAELLLRTHGNQAYAAAQYEVMDRQRGAFPYWQYLTMEDERVRDSHAALDQLVLPADSPFWDSHFPPWDWGCRCQLVPLQQDDVSDIQDEDSGKDPAEQRVVDGLRLDQMETSGTLMRAMPGSNGVVQNFDVRSPSQRGDSYSFQPGTLKMNTADLQGRYDPETWAVFEKWAKDQTLDDGRTVWNWLNQADAPAPKARATPKAVKVLPVAAVKPAAPAPARSSPVSAALKIKFKGPHRSQVETAISAVDKVHDDGVLPKVPIMGDTGSRSLGVYRHIGPKPLDIGVRNAETNWPGLTAVHEIGHLLDHQALGDVGSFASISRPEMEPFRSAVLASKAVAEIRALDPNAQDYFLELNELWARAYAQYIAVKSGDPLLLEQLAKARASSQPWRQWSDQDFAPIRAAIDQIFRAKGWL